MKTRMAFVVDTLRLMVGVGNYRQYCAHMQQRHPGILPMTETDYFRYCQQARFPSKAGVLKRCPC
jgi:uncharacterized short protein YbdD (DUF466 family)